MIKTLSYVRSKFLQSSLVKETTNALK